MIKKCKRVVINVLPLLLSVIGCAYTVGTGESLITVPLDMSFHFDLITVNALFGGFLYTNYSLLVGLLDNPIIERVKNTTIIERRNSHILKGIVFATISVVAGLYIVLIPSTESRLLKVISCFALNVEIVFMAFLIIYFFFSLREMSMLVKTIHAPKGRKKDEEIEGIKNKIRATKK